jgi:dinuclear metal center YbgI/SA1388 family protein
MDKQTLLTYLDTYLDHASFTYDSSANWLQVDSSHTEIKKIWYAVDATTYIIKKAKEENIDLLITHHGMFRWREQTVTGVAYKKIKTLLDNDIALYASHLPLDAHPEVGNNIWLIHAWKRIFGLPDDQVTITPFGDYKWTDIGFILESKTPVPVAGILMPYCSQMQLVKEFYNFWNKENISSIAIVSGGAWDLVREAHTKNIDLFVTWEMVHYQLTLAKELGQSILLWGHYETEKIWPKLLAHHLKKTYPELEIHYIDEKY